MTAPSTATGGYRTQNPATGEVLRQYPSATNRDIAEVLAASARAFADWGARPMDGRGEIVQRAVCTRVTRQARAYCEELFGPAAVVYRVSSDQEAAER